MTGPASCTKAQTLYQLDATEVAATSDRSPPATWSRQMRMPTNPTMVGSVRSALQRKNCRKAHAGGFAPARPRQSVLEPPTHTRACCPDLLGVSHPWACCPVLAGVPPCARACRPLTASRQSQRASRPVLPASRGVRRAAER
eukprot:939346-Amphidinium_carterae.1